MPMAKMSCRAVHIPCQAIARFYGSIEWYDLIDVLAPAKMPKDPKPNPDAYM